MGSNSGPASTEVGAGTAAITAPLMTESEALDIIQRLGASRGSERSRCDVWRWTEHNFPSDSENSSAYYDHGASLAFRAQCFAEERREAEIEADYHLM